MRLYEFEGHELFRKEGIIGPRFAVAGSPAEARQRAEEIGLPVIIKAQVLAGGRYLAGGVQTAETAVQVEEVTQRIFARRIAGMQIHYVMIAEKINAQREFYLGVTEQKGRKSYADVKHYKRRKRWLS